jgi:hypothetical protein
MPERLDEDELADWRTGRNAVYQLAALTVGARLAAPELCGRLPQAPLSGLSAFRGAMARPRVDRRTARSFGRYLSAFAAQLLHACPDHRKIVSGAGPGHVPSVFF